MPRHTQLQARSPRIWALAVDGLVRHVLDEPAKMPLQCGVHHHRMPVQLTAQPRRRQSACTGTIQQGTRLRVLRAGSVASMLTQPTVVADQSNGKSPSVIATAYGQHRTHVTTSNLNAGPLPPVVPPSAPLPTAGAPLPTSRQGSAMPYTLIEGPCAWYGRDTSEQQQQQYVIQLTATHEQELDAALEQVLASGLVQQEGDYLHFARQLTPADFPLPTLGPLLQQILQEVHWGRGFALLRGIPVQRYTPVQSALAYWCMGTYWGLPVRQNKKAHLLGHVKDLGFDSDHKNPVTRIYMTRVAQPWHQDSADLVGLLCLQQAWEGGLSRWCSSITIYNEILAARPDLAPVLSGTWYFDRKNEVPPGKAPYFVVSIANFYQGYLSMTFDDSYYRLAASRHADVPPLTPQQLEVVDLVNSIANRPDVQLTWQLQPGDLQLLNNHTVLHTRDAWVDHEDPALKRHLLRLWLAPPDGRPLPAHYAEGWHSITPGSRGGVVVAGAQDCLPLVATPGN